jgi:hypothetical protein
VSEFFSRDSESPSVGRHPIKMSSYNRYIALGGTTMLYDPEDVKELITTLAHEMRHAMDDALSQGHFNRAHGRGATRYTPTGVDRNQLTDLPHSQRPLEVNAFYTQSLADIAKAIRSTTTTQQLMKIIDREFKKHRVGHAYRYDLNDANYRRLVQRAVAYAQDIQQSKQALSKA